MGVVPRPQSRNAQQPRPVTLSRVRARYRSFGGRRLARRTEIWRNGPTRRHGRPVAALTTLLRSVQRCARVVTVSAALEPTIMTVAAAIIGMLTCDAAPVTANRPNAASGVA